MNTKITIMCIDKSQQCLWDAYIEKNSLSIAWQLYEWHHILERHYPHDFFPLAAFAGASIVGVFPLYQLHESRQFISVPFAVAGGIIGDSPEIEKSLLDAAIALLKGKDGDSIILKQYKHKVGGDLRIDDSYFNRELSISKDLVNVWENLAQLNKDKISSARNSGFSLEYPSLKIREFYSILLKYQHSQGIPCVSFRWIEDLVNSNMYSCAMVRYNGKAIVGTLVKTFKKTISFPFTALNKTDNFHDKAAYWLYWELISHFASQGYEIVHSGRIPANEDVPKFRLGWGGVKNPYYYQYYPNSAISTESLRKRGLKRKLFILAWRLIPLSLAAKLGQRIVRKFP